ncbi:Titin like [Actinidia chinensis var. chinensis]|uniref:Titin like n=1 Tax=Actinidia chinensis var. chinensis TaxID=1590841 RepID=A0A2R6Q4U6_ACTCC|nr:Titin like [Actinidia chinensis var. chinensis]
MPQDSLRSAVYRSFVTCDDPKGVVECGTIRKSKKNNRKRLEDKVENRRIQIPKNLSSSAYKQGKEMASKNVAEDLHKPSSFQLMEVSRGAQKLNKVINSWSTGMTFDGQSKDIAKDLLKGALDLQESLVMLGKLQEASQYMARLKKKQKEKSKGERIDEVGIERMSSHRFTDQNYQTGIQNPRLSVDGSLRDCFEQKQKSRWERVDEVGILRTTSHHFTDQNYQTGFQKPRLSIDGSSRDCFEELRTAIRDGLARQNLLPPERKSYRDKRAPDLTLDIASTSSSQSSMFNSHDFASSESSISSKAPQKSKGSNLIAKLMGLEEIPSQAVQTIGKVSSQRRAMFDLDMPKSRKPQSAAYKVDTEEKKLKEIVETMQLKGLLKSSSTEGYGPQSDRSNASYFKERFTEDAPPIVIMKPFHRSKDSVQEIDEFSHKSVAATVLNAKEENSARLDLELKPRRTSIAEANEPCLQKFVRDVEALDTDEVLRKSKTRDLQPLYEKHRRVNREETQINRPSKVQEKIEEISVTTDEKLSSNKLKASVTVNQQQRKKAIEKNVNRIQKVTPNRKKPEEVENLKSKAVSKSHDQVKVTSPKETRAEIGSIVTKSRISQQKSTSSTVVSKRTTPAASHNCGDRKKNLNNESPVEEPLAANLVVKNVGCEYGEKLIDVSCENEPDTTQINTATADQLLTEEGTDAFEIQITEQRDSSQDSLCDVIPQTTQLETYCKSAEEAISCIDQNPTEAKYFRTESKAEDLFSSSSSFLSYAEDLFDFNATETLAFPATSLNSPGTENTKLLLDCANELVQQKSVICTQTKNPLLRLCFRGLKTSISLAQLVEEVWDGLDNLRSYSKLAGAKPPKDGVFVVLERDMNCLGAVNGGWDSGWRHSFTVDEVEQVVCDIEKLVFSELIEDLFTDFVV